jgi:hemoglobin
MQQRMDRRTVTKGAGAMVGVAAALKLLQQTAPAAGESTPEGAPEQSLYERVGGIFAIAAVVERFSDEIIINPRP